MKTWAEHFDAFGLKPNDEGRAPFQLMDRIFQEYRTIYENATDDQTKINAAIELDEWQVVLEITHWLRDDCIAQYNRTHDKRMIEISKLCEEAMKTAKSRLYALKWLLND